MEQTKLSKPVLPPGANTVTKESGQKVYDIPNPLNKNVAQVPAVQTSQQTAPIPVEQRPVPQTAQIPTPVPVNTATVNTPMPIREPEPVIQAPSPTPINQPVQNFDNQPPAIEQNAQFVPQQPIENNPTVNVGQLPADQAFEDIPFMDDLPDTNVAQGGYVDPVVLQQRIQAEKRDFERQNNQTRRANQFTSPKPLTNDSLKYLVAIGVLSVIIYLIMRVL